MSPGMVIAAPSSGSGKTLLTLGLIHALTRQGYRVGAAKIGPDYIDPGFHHRAGAVMIRNLDSWAMRRPTFMQMIDDLSHASDLIICEGVMGLFDGPCLPSRQPPPAHTETTFPSNPIGSTAECAAWTRWPILLILDACGQSTTAGALVHGCTSRGHHLTYIGVLFNRVGSQRHAEALQEGMARYAPDIPLLGCLPHENTLQLPGRHLGLIQADALANTHTMIAQAADWVSDHLDLASLIDRLQSHQAAPDGGMPPPVPGHKPDPASTSLSILPLGQRMAVARDGAFSFLYDGMVASWKQAGAEIDFFSPLADQAPEDDHDAIILPGGYPELYAGTLAANQNFLETLRQAATRGVAIYGECGGFMTLGNSLIDHHGVRHMMAGLLPLDSQIHTPQRQLGYRQLTLKDTTILGTAGSRFRGHEFHYAQTISPPQIPSRGKKASPLFEARDAAGRALPSMGLCHGKICGSFAHLIDRC